MIVFHERLAMDYVEDELLGLDRAGDALADVEEDVVPGDHAAAGDLRGQELQHVARHDDLAVLLSSVNNRTLGLDTRDLDLKGQERMWEKENSERDGISDVDNGCANCNTVYSQELVQGDPSPRGPWLD